MKKLIKERKLKRTITRHTPPLEEIVSRFFLLSSVILAIHYKNEKMCF